MPALGQLGTGPTELPPTRGILATAPFEDHALADHDDFSYPVTCDLHTDDQPERHSAGLSRFLLTSSRKVDNRRTVNVERQETIL